MKPAADGTGVEFQITIDRASMFSVIMSASRRNGSVAKTVGLKRSNALPQGDLTDGLFNR